MQGCALKGNAVGADGEGLLQGREVGAGHWHDALICEKVRISLVRAAYGADGEH